MHIHGAEDVDVRQEKSSEQETKYPYQGIYFNKQILAELEILLKFLEPLESLESFQTDDNKRTEPISLENETYFYPLGAYKGKKIAPKSIPSGRSK